MTATKRNVRLLSWFNFCHDFRIYGPVMVVYFAEVTGSYTDAVLILAIAKVSSSLFEVPTGVFSDYAGRRVTMIAGQLANIAAIAAYATAPSFALLALGAILEGLSFSLFSGNQDAFLHDTLKDEDREAEFAEHQGNLNAFFQWGLAAAAVVAAILLLRFQFAWLFWLSLVPQAIGLALVVLTVEPKRHGREIETNLLSHLGEALAGFGRDAKLRQVSTASILGFALGEAKHLFRPAYFAILWPAWGLGVARALIHALGAFGFRLSGRLIRYLGELRVLLWSSAAGIALGVGATAVATVASPAISAFTSLFFGPSVVAQTTLMQKSFSHRQRATMGSLVSLGGNIAFAVALFLLGWLADIIGAQYALLCAEVVTVSVTLLYWRLFRREQRERQAKPD